MNANEIRKMDEAATDVRKYFVPMLCQFYSACVESGLKEDQAMQLTVEYLRELLRVPTDEL